MAENKTKPTDASVDAFLDAVADPQRRADAKAIRALIERVSGERAEMWGPSIVGCGTYHYTYESGRQGDSCRLGFSPRASEFALYIGAGSPDAAPLLARLGKHRMGKGCLYLKRLADVDSAVLESLVADGLKRSLEAWPG